MNPAPSHSFLIVDENLREAMRFFGTASGSGKIRALNGSIAMFSGLDYGVFNIALLTEPAVDGQLESRLREASRFFRERTLRWSFWLCEDLIDAQQRRESRQIFQAFGLRSISHPPGMLAAAVLPPLRPMARIEMRRVDDAVTREAFAEITSLCFDIPYLIARTVYLREQAWDGAYEGYVGYVGEKPVAIVAMVAAAGAIGIYSLATLPAFRRMGYGEALLRQAMEDVQRRTGLAKFVLQSTEAGYKIYKRMGFRDVTRFVVYLTR